MKRILKFLFPTFDITKKEYWLCTVSMSAIIGIVLGIIIYLIIYLIVYG